MRTPEISIIMPVYNGETFLPQTLKSLQQQTFHSFEVICVDDGSNDSSIEIISNTAGHDSRFLLLQQQNAGAGAARNYGFTKAKGKYVIFLDCDDLFCPDLLKKLYKAASENQADITACHFTRFDESGRTSICKGVHAKWLPEGQTVFDYRDCPDYIMSIINPIPWNKLYRSDFIREQNLKFEEISSTNDITFASVSVAAAQRIVYIPEHLVKYRVGHAGTISSTKAKNLKNIAIAVSSAVRQAKALPHSSEIRNGILRFCIENYRFALMHYIPDFSAPVAQEFYTHVHETFNTSDFDHVTASDLHDPELYQMFRIVRRNDYPAMKRLHSQKLIVSLTTYPGRIGMLHKILDTVYAQTRPADEIILWLASDQFPRKEADLPAPIHTLIKKNHLTVRWCEDLKPHKKYFHALQEYPNDIVVTIDDDLLYPADMLEKLYMSYLQFPDAVSAMRAHLIVITEEKKILPYSDWIKETDACLLEPSMQLLATGGAGTLYPPNLYRREFFDSSAIMENCLWADDLWLKAMQLMSNIPVVVACPFVPLRYLPGSQDNALCHTNVDQNQNDIQLAKIIAWMDDTFEPGIFIRKLTSLEIGVALLGVEALCSHFDRERRNLKAELARMHTVQEGSLSNLLSTTSSTDAVTFPKPYWQIRLINILAWLPTKILRGLMCWDEQGLSYTFKRALRKIFRKI